MAAPRDPAKVARVSAAAFSGYARRSGVHDPGVQRLVASLAAVIVALLGAVALGAPPHAGRRTGR